MTSLDTTALLPGDIVLALRSFPGRFHRALDPDRLADGDRTVRDELTTRRADSGDAAIDRLRDATRTSQVLARAIDDVLLHDEPALHPAVGDPARRRWPAPTEEAVDDLLDELTTALTGLAGRLEPLTAERWERHGHVATVGRRSVVELARALVATVAADLRLLDADLRDATG